MQPGGTGRLPERAAAGPDPQARVLTIPNALSVARLAGLPVFLWLALARALNQQSRLGQLLDPAADRLYIVATIIALAIRAIIPWWLVGLLAARELLLGVVLARLRSRGYEPLQVSFVGKAATLCLYYAFPLLLLGAHAGTFGQIARIVGWAMAIWGTALYWCAAGLYLVQSRGLLAAGESDPGDCPP